MPTTLPDAATRIRHQRQRLLVQLVPIVVTGFYLLLLVWSAASVVTDMAALFAPDQGRDGRSGAPAYNPMEPTGLPQQL
jgi:hypothetical protein